ncbi:MAG: 1-deoxy-D-xylulose-5-phosphate reductoisomerase [Oscillospiraceae bacterium]|jgi:1-deoxy-D-xylulose-5-phosphate reductoisomerase|nr:1-deoxy-D-xylulose-5-phosphate reductoisomerase [Oscillospiraceae bacterium]
MKKLTVLGSTGSIGTQALQTAAAAGYAPFALAAGGNVRLLEEQIRLYKPKYAALVDEDAAKELNAAVKDTATRVLGGPKAAETLAETPCDMVLNAIVGIAGLPAAVACLRAGNRLALANKESLVAGGALVTRLAKESRNPILPVDSEHSAIFQCLQGIPGAAVQKIILTASGGPFFGKSKEELTNVSLEEALRHPNWSMGAKITVDSATMMNKALELIEACWLFDVPEDKVDVVVHRQSVVHSAVETVDGAVIAQLGAPDMRLPIQYALTYPKRLDGNLPRLSLTEYGTLTFSAPDTDAFPAISLAREAMRSGGLAPCTLNAANEEANTLFRQGRIKFTDISRLVADALQSVPQGNPGKLDDILAADKTTRAYVKGLL